jgi:MFS family permease
VGRPRRLRRAWWLLGSAVWAQVTISVAELGVPTIAPYLKQSFGLSAAGVGLLVATINLGRIIGSIPAGRAVDRVGEELVMTIGGLGVAVFFAVAAFVSGVVAVGASLVGAGIFAGSATPAGAKLVLDAFPPARRGLPMGIRQSAVPLGALIAALLLPVIAHRAGVSWALAVGGVVPIAGSLGVFVVTRWIPAGSAPAPDERRERPPLRVLAGDHNVVRATAWGVVFVGGQYTLASYLVLDLTAESHLSVAEGSLMLALASAAGVFGRIGWGMLSDRVWAGRRRPPLVAVTVTGTLSAVALAALPALPALPLVLAAATWAGLSMLSWQGVWMSLMSELAPKDGAGTTVGFGLTFVNVAIVVWPPAFGLLADLSGGYRLSWAFLALALAASGLLLGRLEEPGSERQARYHANPEHAVLDAEYPRT